MRHWRSERALQPGEPARVPRSLPAAVVPLVIAVAIVGYLAGHSGGSGELSQASRTAKTANLLVEYPLGWAPTSRGPTIPGLRLAGVKRFAPVGAAASAGLLVGSLPKGEAGPLPTSFLTLVRKQPETAIVNLLELQAYRYRRLSVRGFAKALIVFVIPNVDGASTALACFAAAAGSPYMRTCEQTAASATVTQTHAYQLVPDATYAASISATIATLDRLRAALERELRATISASSAERIGRRLAAGFTAAARSLAPLEPAFPAEKAQVALAAALERARRAAAALAPAAAGRSASGYAAAQTRISAAELAVDRALENFVLLGYSPVG
jgi:hypothetical protein